MHTSGKVGDPPDDGNQPVVQGLLRGHEAPTSTALASGGGLPHPSTTRTGLPSTT
ncbi:hypothetical protein PtB15_18B410 [Puccinia triticina]|nr:hypothetical protein PtB15_18B410 [Puccinia triticina]